MKKIAIGILVVIAIVLIAVSLRKGRVSPSDKPLICHVGGTMRPVISELARLYELETGQKIEINSAGSGELLAYISLHKRGDIYICHDPFIHILMQKYRMGVDGWIVAELTPVIVTQKGNPKNIKGVTDLARKDVEVILTDYKRSSLGWMLSTIFAKAGIDFEQLNNNKKIHTNRSGGYAANFVMTGNADAAMVWNAVAHLRSEKLDVVRIDKHLPVPNVDAVTSATGKSYILTPVRVTVATLTHSKYAKAAKKFAEYVASDKAGKVFSQFGFTMSDNRKLYEDGRDLGTSLKNSGPESTGPGGKGLKIYAGAGLRRGIDKLTAAFEEDTGIVVEPEYGGSGIIMTRVQMNDDGDLFMPGDVSWVEMLNAKTGIVESMTQISYFVPVIIVKKGNPKNIRSVADFFRDDVSVGLGRPQACQVGKVSRKILENYGFDASNLEHKQSLTVNEIGIWVKMNAIDTGIVWGAIATNIADDVDIVIIPKDKNVISKVVVGLLTDSKDKIAAQKFIDFLISDKGRKILRESGFQTEAPGE